MVGTAVMEWLRTPLTIFRQAAWVETCCYAPKVWYFQSRARSTSYCLIVHFLWNIFPPLFLPSVQQLPRTPIPAPWMTSKRAEWREFHVVPVSPSHYQLLLPLKCSSCYSIGDFASFQLRRTSCALTGRRCVYGDCCSHLYKPWLLALISWVAYCIDVFLP